MAVSNKERSAQQEGVALLITLLALALLSLLGLYLTLNANTELQISDNYETQIQASYAALAGLNHARAVIRGLASRSGSPSRRQGPGCARRPTP